jgi:Undecaprenyl-phosphate glucose phosphotransferase
MLKESNRFLLTLIVIFDLIILLAAFIFAYYLTYSNLDIFNWKIYEIIFSAVVICILFIGLEKIEFSHAYRYRPLSHIIKGLIIFQFFSLSIFYFCILLHIHQFSNKLIIYYMLITFSVFLFERTFIKVSLILLRRRGFNYKRFIIIGVNEIGYDFYKMSKTKVEMGLKVIGFLDDKEKDILKSDEIKNNEEIKHLILGSTDKLEALLINIPIDNVIITIPLNNVEKLMNIFYLCEKYGVKAELVPQYLKIISKNPSVRKIKNFTLIGLHNMPLDNPFSRFIKRLFDLSVSAFCLILFMPFFLIIVSLIKLESKGPVFFFQKRTGYNQKQFNIIKFRTMNINKDANKKQATKDDPIKTLIGKFLRKTNMDEVPQLINVIRGEMSLIGPRPHMLAHTEEFNKKYDKYLVRHWVKPGLTGWAQVNGWRGDSDIGVRIKFDLEYIENWSIWFDLKIFLLTFFGKKVKKYAH